MKNWLIQNKITIFFLTIIVFIIIFLQASIPLWRNHLIVDIWVYYERARHFFTYRTISNLINNEHLPGALFYLFIPSLVFFIDKSFDIYVWYFFLLGFIFLSAHIAVYRRISGYPGVLIFLLILLFSGPILLFRYELVVSLLVLLSIYFFIREKQSLAALFLGIATTIKIYPVLILPYYLIIFLRNKRYEKLLRTLGFFFLGILIIGGAYFLIGGSLKELSGSIYFHSLKPLGMESPITSAFILFFKSNYHRLPELFGAYGVFGVNIDSLPVDLSFFNFLPPVIVSLLYLYIYYSKTLYKKLRIEIVFLILLVFLVFSKNMNPQYLFWAFSLVPILKVKEKKKEKSNLFSFLIIVLIIALLTQYVYPILYTDLINNFRENIEIFTPVAYLLLLRNFLLLVLLVISCREFLVKRNLK